MLRLTARQTIRNEQVRRAAMRQFMRLMVQGAPKTTHSEPVIGAFTFKFAQK
jgi:hypothetical protein